MQTAPLLTVLSVGFLLGCESTKLNPLAQEPQASQNAYMPKLSTAEKIPPSNKLGTAYRFTEEQLARIARTNLETNRLVTYLEQRWPVERLKAYCVKANIFPEGCQNLVALKCPVETDLHRWKSHGFDRIWVYVGEDDGRSTYFEDAGRKWHRWEYSINVVQGKRRWAIIENLPNDFLDDPRYDPK